MTGISCSPLSRRALLAVLGPLLTVVLAVAALTAWTDRRDDHQLRFLQRHGVGVTSLSGARLERRMDSDVSGTFLERRRATVMRIWAPEASVRSTLLAIDRVSMSQPQIRGLARCLVAPDGERGAAIFTWRPSPGADTVEVYGTYYVTLPAGGCTAELRNVG